MTAHEYDTGAVESAGVAALSLASLTLLLREWKLVLGTALVCMLAAAAAATLLPRSYTAVTVMVETDQGGETGLQALAARAAGDIPMLSIGRGNPNARLVGAVLSSRALRDSVESRIERPPRRVKTVHDPRQGSIRIEVPHRDPVRAARIANAYPVAINAIVAGIGTQSVSTKQELLQQRLAAARVPLQAAEERLADFRRRSNAPELRQQAIEAVSAAAELQRMIASKEVELSQIRRVATPENPQLRAAVDELAALRAQLRQLVSGTGGEVFPSLRESPDLQTDATRLMREFTEAQQVYTALQIAIAESQISTTDLPVLSVLDVATVPEKPSGPGTAVILALAAILGAMLGAAIAVGRQVTTRLRATPEGRSLADTWRGMRRRPGGGHPALTTDAR
jgi:tyrosine-protein kinase Etk/Wzc